MDDDTPKFEIIDLEQRSPEWHLWRANGVGASDAGILNGRSWIKTEDQLLAEKLQPPTMQKKAELSDAAKRGIALEPEALARFNSDFGVNAKPACVQSKNHPWMRCSLDGFCSETKTLVEIKCGRKNYEGVRKYGHVPPWHQDQLYFILAVTGFDEINFYSYDPDDPPINLVCNSYPWIDRRQVRLTRKFWERVENSKMSPT